MRALPILFGVFALIAGQLFGQTPVAAPRPPVAVRDVKFMQTKIGGQEHSWNRMQVELMANGFSDPKFSSKRWVDKVKVTVTQIYQTDSKNFEDWNYYRSTATVLTLEVNKPRSVLFYLPGDIVKRDNLRKEPDFYFVQLEVGGTELPIFDAPSGQLVPDQSKAVHTKISKKALFDPAKDAADRGVVNTPGVLRPQYLLLYGDPIPAVPPSPEFVREDVPSR